MPQNIRACVPGGAFFFTVTLLERRRQLLTEPIDDLRAGFKAARQRRSSTVEAVVILPGHLHGIWTLSSRDADFSTRWHDIESVFITLNGRQMITFGFYRWNAAKGGMRFAFPPYGFYEPEAKRGRSHATPRQVRDNIKSLQSVADLSCLSYSKSKDKIGLIPPAFMAVTCFPVNPGPLRLNSFSTVVSPNRAF